MKWLILLLFIPIIEVLVFFRANEIIGSMYTIGIIIFTALLGVFFVKLQANEIFDTFKNNDMEPMLFFSHGLLIFIAGILLLTPGFITDSIGFLLLIPYLRLVIIKHLARRLTQNGELE